MAEQVFIHKAIMKKITIMTLFQIRDEDIEVEDLEEEEDVMFSQVDVSIAMKLCISHLGVLSGMNQIREEIKECI